MIVAGRFGLKAAQYKTGCMVCIYGMQLDLIDVTQLDLSLFTIGYRVAQLK